MTTSSVRASVDRTCRFRKITGHGIRFAIEVTRRCNLKCPHCFVALDHVHPQLEAILTVVRQLSVIDVQKVIITGGEPLIRADLEQIIAACAAQNLNIDLNSNLIALSPERAQALVKAGITEVSASLYGDETTHDSFVDRQGAFSKTVRGIGLLRELGIPVDIHCALSDQNIGQIEPIVKLCISLDCASLTFFTILPLGSAGGRWPHRAEALRLIQEQRGISAIPIRTIGLAETDLSECTMGSAIVGLTAEMNLKTCLLAKNEQDSAINPLEMGLGSALQQLSQQMACQTWRPACYV